MKKIYFIIFCLLGFIVLLFSYKNISNNIPISYFDEEWWIRDSYFFQFYINGDYGRNVWDDQRSSDQPNATRFLIGAWIYPKYLEAKKANSSLDYTKYLINNGFYFNMNLSEYVKYKDSLGQNFTTLNYGDSGFKDDLIKKYGSNIIKNINLIMHIRQLNIILLSITLILLFVYLKSVKGFIFSLFFAFLYASSNLILTTSLMAHSEALFLLFFNMSLIYMLKYLSDDYKYKNLLIFSLFLGLCFSTKLNGIVLYLPYLVIVLYKISVKAPKNKQVGVLIKIILPLLISLIVFVILNPYVFSSPILNIIRMFAQREMTVLYQISAFSNSSLPSLMSRVSFIAQTLFIDRQNYILSIFSSILFVSGVYIEILNIRKGVIFSRNIMIVFCSVLFVTLFYLQLAWPRYLVHLVTFYVYYVVVGLYFYLTKIIYYIQSRINNNENIKLY